MYNNAMNPYSQEDIINSNMHLVYETANKIYFTIPQGFVEKDDLIGEGIVALIKAAKKYDISQSSTFESYARMKIHGSMIDLLRKQDILPQKKRSELKKFEKDIQKLESEIKRSATEAEILKCLNISKEKYTEMLHYINISTLVYIDSCDYDYLESNLNIDIESDDNATMEEYLIKAIDFLNEKEKLILQLRFYEDLNFKEIAEVMGVSNARISQIYSKAIMRLKGKINQLKKQDANNTL